MLKIIKRLRKLHTGLYAHWTPSILLIS